MGRRLGQHFLTDTAILDRIVDAIDPAAGDIVLEIGPGKGTLTARLAPRVGHVVAIEKDERLAEELGEKGKGKRETSIPGQVSIVVGDALELDWSAIVREKTLPLSLFPFPPLKVIGNIPYYITSPLIEKALTPPLPSVIVMLVQREVADRLAAPPGSKTYGALSVGVQATARVERLFVVKSGAFHPPPKVDSAVVRLTPLSDPLVRPNEHAAFRAFIAALFSQRRKQLARSLRFAWGASKAEVDAALDRLSLDPTLRPEVITPKQLVDVFRYGESLTESAAEG